VLARRKGSRDRRLLAFVAVVSTKTSQGRAKPVVKYMRMASSPDVHSHTCFVCLWDNRCVSAAARLRTCARRWCLHVGERLPGGFRSDVYQVLRPDGTEAVLKLCGSLEEAHSEAAALQVWAETEVSVALFDFDQQAGALLLERLQPGSAMPRGQVGSVDTAASMLSSLHERQPASFRFRDVAGTSPSHERHARDDLVHERRTRDEPRRAMAAEQALPAVGALMERLSADTERKVLLHGDFLTKNLLRDGDGYRAIDPVPRLGDPCADVGLFATDQPALIIMDTAAELARLLDLDVDRATAWSVVWTVLQTAQAWREDQQALDELLRTSMFQRLLDG
jgi:fructosamine-3-kinase